MIELDLQVGDRIIRFQFSNEGDHWEYTTEREITNRPRAGRKTRYTNHPHVLHSLIDARIEVERASPYANPTLAKALQVYLEARLTKPSKRLLRADRIERELN